MIARFRVMRPAFICAFIGVCLGLSRPAWAEDYIPGLDDVPLAPGLEAAAEPDMMFDKPEGRLVETSAQGRIPASSVQRFYASTLPQMGWQADPATPDRYVRDQEMLDVATRTENKNHSIVTFRLSPRK